MTETDRDHKSENNGLNGLSLGDLFRCFMSFDPILMRFTLQLILPYGAMLFQDQTVPPLSAFVQSVILPNK